MFPISIIGEPHSPQTGAAMVGLAGPRHNSNAAPLTHWKELTVLGEKRLTVLASDISSPIKVTETTACPHQFLQVTPGVQRGWRSHQQTAQLPSPGRRTKGKRTDAPYVSGHSSETCARWEVWGEGMGREGWDTGKKMSAECLVCAGTELWFTCVFSFIFPITLWGSERIIKVPWTLSDRIVNQD